MPEITITAELILETARAIRDVRTALETVDVPVVDPATGAMLTSRITRIEYLCRYLPEILDPQRIVCLADNAADRPDWWRCNRLHWYNPEMTLREIGRLTGLRESSVRDYVRRVEIPRNSYDNLPAR